jgi:dolichyl-phosphate beta-glucosyltransferase
VISIIIAAYNEEKRIQPSLFKIKEFVIEHGMDYEIIVVDDGSTDRTSNVVMNLTKDVPNLEVIGYKNNRGKGYALRQGVLASKGKIVLLTDADLSTPVDELTVLLPLVSDNKCDIAIGSRALALSKIIRKQPLWRQSMGKLFNKVVKFLIMDDFSDTQCGFKLFSGDIARGLFKEARINRFAYDVEILALAKKKGYNIIEIPIRWINSPESKVNPISDSLNMIVDLLRIRLNVGSLKSKNF